MGADNWALCPKCKEKGVDIMAKKRCACSRDQCWKCWFDFLDEKLKSQPNTRECYCGLSVCGACNYYKSIGRWKLKNG